MYNLSIPEKVVFGCGSLEKLGGLVPENARTLIVSGSSAQRNGIVRRISELLAPREVAVFDRVQPEPTIQQVDEIRAFMRKFNAQAVIAVGGGSALDAGKVAAAAGCSEVPTADF